ncbi:hypothetical protein FHS10_000160 [Mucilaginibacter dorajii]|nr:hypothetical protein [Mucilaginibacter dorajii]
MIVELYLQLKNLNIQLLYSPPIYFSSMGADKGTDGGYFKIGQQGSIKRDLSNHAALAI